LRLAAKRKIGCDLHAPTNPNHTPNQDLNVDPKLPFPDESFDVVTCVVSVDYLTRPLEVFKEASLCATLRR